MPKAAAPVIADCVWAMDFIVCVTEVKVKSLIIFLLA